MKQVKGGITAPKGFRAAGIACGIKKSGKSDLALIFSEVPAAAAGVFTQNQVKAAPIVISQKVIKRGIAQAIIANAGNANCWTGKQGRDDAEEMAGRTAENMGIDYRKVLVTSTGVIARPLPMDKVRAGISEICGKLSVNGGGDAAQAILTTDTRKKEIAVKVGKITIAGIAKGSGMIAPGMATMHAFITTDAKIGAGLLQKLLVEANAQTFNMVSVDDCMSTNDCVFVLANGLSKVRVEGKMVGEFFKGLAFVCRHLAIEIARDGEGATKLMTVKAVGASCLEDARAVVKALIGSYLLKAAVYGRDKNVGRILQAVGTTDAKVDWEKFEFDWEIGEKEDLIIVDLKAGKYYAVGWGCDLTEGYIKINAHYRT